MKDDYAILMLFANTVIISNYFIHILTWISENAYYKILAKEGCKAMNLKNNDLVFYISIKQLEILSENVKTNEIRFSFITLCYYNAISNKVFHPISQVYLKEMAKRSLMEWISRCDKSTVSLGVSGGYIGYAYLCYSIFRDEKWYKKWKSMTDDQFSKRAYQLLLQYEYYNDHRFLDALNGVVCIVHYLIQTGYIDKDFYSTIYYSLLDRIYRFINITDTDIDLGISHGILGLLAVIYECEVLLNYHHNSSVRIAEKYYKLFDNDSIEFPEYVCFKNKDNPEYKKSKKFGWCYGSLETLNILYTIFKETNHDNLKLIENLIIYYSTLKFDSFGLNSPIFCHGYGSTYLIYKHFSTFFNISISQEFINQLETRILSSSDCHDKYVFSDINLENVSIIDGIVSPTVCLLCSNSMNGYDFFSKALFIKYGDLYV